MRANWHRVAGSEIRCNRAGKRWPPVRVQSGFFPEEITGGPQMDLRRAESSFRARRSLLLLLQHTLRTYGDIPARCICTERIELIPWGEKSRALTSPAKRLLSRIIYSQLLGDSYICIMRGAFDDPFRTRRSIGFSSHYYFEHSQIFQNKKKNRNLYRWSFLLVVPIIYMCTLNYDSSIIPRQFPRCAARALREISV